ncbi:MAG: DUF481 domain-containing protein [Gammaproteobacteria bacterium]|nr:DUF481 domain-containing protein [Gammaproteobacteria bacterium]
MRIDPVSQELGLRTNVNLDLSGKNGNTKNAKYSLGTKVQSYKTDYTQLAIFNYEYGESSNVKDTDNGFLHLRQVWYSTDTLFWEGYAQIENDEFKRLTIRALAGGGARFKLIHKPQKHSAYIGAGLFYSKEELDDAAGTTDAGTEYYTRLNIYQIYKYAINRNSRLLNTVYYQPDIEEFSDYRLLEKFKFQVDINSHLSINISLDIARDNQPPENVEKTDTSYTTGFEYKF